MATRPGPQDPNHLRLHHRFMEAINRGDIDKVRKFLQDPKIDVNFIEDGTGLTALHIAAARNATAILRLLVATGRCRFDLKDGQGRSAARLAMIVANNPAVSRYLYDLQYGNRVVTEGASRRKGGQAQSEEELE